ncbi:MAG: pilus assembly protein [Dokdonella sp.]|nr:pilus assembly protein [Dokdonella sp.]
MSRTRKPMPASQRGAVLFVALVFLILITLLSLTAIGGSILQEKMTSGMRNGQLSALGADSALRGGEAWMWNLNFTAVAGQPLPPCIGSSTQTCVYRPTTSGALRTDVQKFRTSHGWETKLPGAPAYAHAMTGLTGANETASLAEEPQFIIEDMGDNVPPGLGRQSGMIDPENATAYRFYRITARSTGGSAAVQRVFESVFSSTNLTDTGTEP